MDVGERTSERSSVAFRVCRSPLCAAPSPHFLRAFDAVVVLAPGDDGASQSPGEIGIRRCARVKSVFHSTFEEYFIFVENCLRSRVAIQRWNSKTRQESKVPSRLRPFGEFLNSQTQ